MFLKQIIIVFSVIISSISDNNHSVAKRALLFPQYSVLQFTYGISAPVLFPARAVTLSMCIQVNYNLPYNVTNFFPQIVAARENSYDLSRDTFYEHIKDFLNGFGFHGEHCLLRMICEISESPMRVDHNENLLEKIVHFLFTPSLDLKETAYNNISSPTLEAEKHGQENKQCDRKYSECPISLVNLFTSKYIT